MTHYDVAVIGAGQAAEPIVSAGRRARRNVVVFERSKPGGSCVNWGCTPSKAVIESVNLAQLASRAQEFGIEIDGIRADLRKILASADGLVEHSVRAMTDELGDSLVTDTVTGLERENGRWRVDLKSCPSVTADSVVLNVGSRTRYPEIPGLDDALDAENWLTCRELPESLALLGSGPVALELAQVYRRLGTRVTMVETEGRLLPNIPEEISLALQNFLEADGIEFRFGTQATGFAQGRLEGTDVEAGRVFVATGRVANTDLISIPGLPVDDDGWVQTDERRRTGIEGLWAVGDLLGRRQMTHYAWDDGRVVADDLFGQGERRPFPHHISGLFTDPQLGLVGELSGTLHRFDVAKNAAAQTARQAWGQVWIAESDGLISGAAVLAARGAEMAQLITPMLGRPLRDLDALLTAHPTWMEAIPAAISDL